MDIEVYKSVLLNRIQRLTAWDAGMIVSYVFSRKGPRAVREYAAAMDGALHHLINEALYHLQQPSLRPLYRPGSSSHVIPATIGQRQLHQGLTQLYPSGSSRGVQAQFLPTGPTGGFQRPPELTGFADSRMPRNRQNPSSSKAQRGPCNFFFIGGHCMKGGNCRFSQSQFTPLTHYPRWRARSKSS